MKRIKLLSLAVAASLVGGSLTAEAQLINLVEPTFIVNSPASVFGSKSYTVSNDGGGATTQWGRAIDSAWFNFPVGMDLADTLGCSPSAPGTFAGKFALISRGNCQFSEKAYNAQLAGAVAVIIYNNTSGGPVGMAAGNNAASVTIPVIMISQADGIALANLIKNNQSVNASLTNWGFGFAHDLAIVNNSMALQHNMAIPKYELNGDPASAYRSYLGGLVANVGASTETSVKLKSKLSFTPNGGSTAVLLQDSVSAQTFAPIDSVLELISPNAGIIPTINNQAGRIDVEYSLTAASADDQTGNNVMSYSVEVTDSIYSKGRINANGEPVATIGYRFNSAVVNTWGPMFFINNGGRFADKVQFTVSNGDNTTSLDGNNVTFYVFKWTDANSDNLVDAGELSLNGAGVKTFTSLDSNYDMFTLPIAGLPNPNNPVSLDAKSYYWIAAEVANNMFLACDGEISYFMRSYSAKNSSLAATEYWAPQFQGSYNDLQNSTGFLTHFPFQSPDSTNINGISFTGSKGLIPAITLHSRSNATSSVGNVSRAASLKVFPNPSNGVVNFKMSGDKIGNELNVTVMDAVGRVVRKENVAAKNGVASINVSELANGNYFFVVRDRETITSSTISIAK